MTASKIYLALFVMNILLTLAFALLGDGWCLISFGMAYWCHYKAGQC